MWPQMDLHYYFMQCMFNLSSCFSKRLTGGPQVRCTPFHLPLTPLPAESTNVAAMQMLWHEEQQMCSRQKKKKKVVPVPDIKRNLSQLVWDCLWCPEPPSWWDLCKTLTMRNAIPVDGPGMKGKWALWWLRCGKNPVGPTPRGTFNREWPPLGSKRTRQVKGRDTHDLLPPSLQEMKAGRGKIPVTHSPHQGGPSEGSTLPPAQLQAPQAQRQ